MDQKDPELLDRGGLFIFGYRMLNSNDNTILEDESIVKGVFTTVHKEFDEESGTYIDDKTQYFTGKCDEVYEEDVAS